MRLENFYFNFQKKILASLLLSKNEILDQSPFFNVLKAFHLIITTKKTHDINLLIINSLWFLLYGSYPKVVVKKKIIKSNKKTNLTFILSFSKKKQVHTLIRTLNYSAARQTEFVGFVYKTIFFVTPQSNFPSSITTFNSFFMADYLYNQQAKNILTVNQNITITMDCVFKNNLQAVNFDYLRSLNLPLHFDEDLNFQLKEKNQ